MKTIGFSALMNIELLTPNRTPISFRRSKRALRMRLQIDGKGEVTLVAPWHSGESEIHSFFIRHRPWVQKHLDKVDKLKALRPTPQYQSNDIFYYFGEPLVLEVQPSDRKRTSIKVRGSQMIITLHRAIGKSEGIGSVKRAIREFYRKKAEEVIRDRLDHFNAHYGYRFNRVAFRDQKSRWGSCSRLRNLNFNWRLIMAPIEVIDYVVIHELCHLKEMNHSSRFWALVQKEVPDLQAPKKWLKENAVLLTI